jgi:hypothetical protein
MSVMDAILPELGIERLVSLSRVVDYIIRDA